LARRLTFDVTSSEAGPHEFASEFALAAGGAKATRKVRRWSTVVLSEDGNPHAHFAG